MIGILFVFGLVVIYLIATVFNQKTDVPIECRDIEVEKCSSCHNHSCSIKNEVLL